MPRLFVALEVPHELRRQLLRLATPMRGARWTKEEQLHLTLRFLGEVPPEGIPPLVAALREVRAAPVTTRLSGVGQFPPRRAAHVLWAGLAPSPELDALAAGMERAVVSLGFAPADHPFSPHLTLARLKDAPRAEVERFLEVNAKLESAPFTVDEAVLFESVLSQQGSRYTALARLPLGAPPGA